VCIKIFILLSFNESELICIYIHIDDKSTELKPLKSKKLEVIMSETGLEKAKITVNYIVKVLLVQNLHKIVHDDFCLM
jgi:hypothetical protein